MVTLTNQVHAWMTQQSMLEAGQVILVAVSGGPDSLCMLHLLSHLRHRLAFDLHVAHFDHQLRDDSGEDADFVATTATAWGIPFTIESADVRTYARSGHMNLHHAARILRYRFLARLARDLPAQAVAVAHNANDQAETVLMHLLRGAGPKGMGGMRSFVAWDAWSQGVDSNHNGPALIRPLLTTPRAHILDYCTHHHLQPRDDCTNADTSYTRNRIRHDLLPRLIEYNPDIIAALGRTAERFAEEHAFVQSALDSRWAELACRYATAIHFDGACWATLHPALQREALRRAYGLLGGSATLEVGHVEAACAAVHSGVGRHIEFPGGIGLTIGYQGRMVIGLTQEFINGPQLAQEAMALPLPGQVALDHGWMLETSYHHPANEGASTRWEIQIDAEAVGGALMARRRQPGDRMRPVGGIGSRRIQDIMVDMKVPRQLRKAWPLITAADAIVWIAGIRAAEGFLATSQTDTTIQVRLIPPPANDQHNNPSNPRVLSDE